VQAWDEAALSYDATGQECEHFAAHAALAPGDVLRMAGMDWQVIAAPGHDDDAVMLFEPAHGVLIAGDAIWGQGLSVVFPELVQEGQPPSSDATQAAFAAVAATLDRIEQLQPRVVIPGHGSPFTDLAAALAQSRSRLAHFRAHPEAHALYAAKVLLKFHLLTVQRIPRPALLAWARSTPYLRGTRERLAPGLEMDAWLGELLHALAASGAAAIDGEHVLNR
jgi:glyoxylase-like metal-dependent hydrolase (beta-lactamase superfamily II)